MRNFHCYTLDCITAFFPPIHLCGFSGCLIFRLYARIAVCVWPQNFTASNASVIYARIYWLFFTSFARDLLLVSCIMYNVLFSPKISWCFSVDWFAYFSFNSTSPLKNRQSCMTRGWGWLKQSHPTLTCIYIIYIHRKLFLSRNEQHTYTSLGDAALKTKLPGIRNFN